jgi:DNA repair protein RecN (Recombination protein N)
MLEELRIRNFAIIDSLDLNFAPGFNVITGETGAGKSIMIDALALLLGGKADNAFVRAGADKSLVEGVFALSPEAKATLLPFLKKQELIEGDGDGFVTLTRELRENGRSTARINGVTVNADVLREVGEVLVDVHGQSDHLSLLKASTHIDLLDRYADLLEMRAAMATMVDRVHNVRSEIRHLLEDEAALKRRAERLRTEVEEIDAAQLKPGEDDELRAERTRLANSEQLATLTADVIMLLKGDDSTGRQLNAIDQLTRVVALLGKLSHIDDELEEYFESADTLTQQVQELAIVLQDYGEALEYNPGRLDEVEERLETINRLRKRYGATIEAVLEHADKARVELNTLENSEERLEELRAQEEKLLRYIGEMGLKLSQVRKTFGDRLAHSVMNELGDLRMQNTRFEVSIIYEDNPEGCYVGDRRVSFSPTGIDHVEFMMSANPGEPLRPLVKVASGGETARIMLGLKRVLSLADHTPTLIFDEIDQGIGGRVGGVVGEKLWMLALNHQVLCVTHLAQLAGFADRHFRVLKDTNAKRTTTRVIELDEDERVKELAEMLGATSDSGSQTARDILNEAHTKKESVRPKSNGQKNPTQKQLL